MDNGEQGRITHMTRREALRLAAAPVSALLSIPGQNSPDARSDKSKDQSPGFLSGSNLYRDLITYYNFGNHRTASDADIKTTYWIAKQLRAAGFQLKIQPFTLKQFFISRSSLKVAGLHVRSFPLWPPRSTGPEPLGAPLALFKRGAAGEYLRGRVAVVAFPFDPSASLYGGSQSELIRAASKAGAVAVLAVTESATGEVIALDVPVAAQAWPVPVLLVGQRDEAALYRAAEQGAEAVVLLDGRYEQQAEAKNVVARLERGRDWMIVSTAQSGWFRCGGERGPGVALLIGLARWAAKRQSSVSFLFASLSGQELGAAGMNSFMSQYALPRERVLCWLHLGASIATRGREDAPESRGSLLCSRDLAPLLTEAFADLPQLAPADRASFEYEMIRRAGYISFALNSSHKFYHTPADSPETTSPDLLQSVGRALASALEAIEAKGRA